MWSPISKVISFLGLTSLGQTTMAGSLPVTIANNQSNLPVAVQGTPAVSISGTPTVSISGTPTVSVSGTPTVSVSGTPSVSIASDTYTEGDGLPVRVLNDSEDPLFVAITNNEVVISGEVTVAGTPNVAVINEVEVIQPVGVTYTITGQVTSADNVGTWKRTGANIGADARTFAAGEAVGTFQSAVHEFVNYYRYRIEKITVIYDGTAPTGTLDLAFLFFEETFSGTWTENSQVNPFSADKSGICGVVLAPATGYIKTDTNTVWIATFEAGIDCISENVHMGIIAQNSFTLGSANALQVKLHLRRHDS
jgi:hypothetical protein